MIIVYEDGLKHYDHLTIPCQIENHIIFVYLLVRDLSLKIQEQTIQKTDRAFGVLACSILKSSILLN